jgi:hypothetical protein
MARSRARTLLARTGEGRTSAASVSRGAPEGRVVGSPVGVAARRRGPRNLRRPRPFPGFAASRAAACPAGRLCRCPPRPWLGAQIETWSQNDQIPLDRRDSASKAEGEGLELSVGGLPLQRFSRLRSFGSPGSIRAGVGIYPVICRDAVSRGRGPATKPLAGDCDERQREHAGGVRKSRPWASGADSTVAGQAPAPCISGGWRPTP